jgi:NAD/NADP transhydrogenase beta subunit
MPVLFTGGSFDSSILRFPMTSYCFTSISTYLGAWMGSITATGSIVAYGKLAGTSSYLSYVEWIDAASLFLHHILAILIASFKLLICFRNTRFKCFSVATA